MSLDNESLSLMYRCMVKIRCFEEKTAELYERALIPGACHLYIGEEAVAVGVCANLRKNDHITSTHRGHGHFIARGTPLNRLMAELMAKATGTNRGMSGSMHLSYVDGGGISQATSIVGAGIPLAVGLALASKLKGTDQVAISFFGDGAANQGTFHEAVNLAAIWKLPVVFVCENNRYASSVPQAYATAGKNISGRGNAYGIPGKTLDGNDVVTVYEVAAEAVRRARDREGPTLIECVTDRWRAHGEGSPEFRSFEEIEKAKKNDPIERYRIKLLEMGILTDGQVDEIDRAIAMELEEAVKFAIESPQPIPEDALKYVYAL